MKIKQTAFQGTKWTTISTIGHAIFQLLQITILTRFLPKEAFGLVAIAVFFVHFSNIFVDMGISSGILHRQNANQHEYSSIYWLSILISIVLYVVLLILTPFFSDFYKEIELTKLIPILGVNLILMAMGRQHRIIMQKCFRFKRIAIIELFSYFIGLSSATILAINNFGLYSLVYSTLLTSFLSNLLFLLINFKTSPIYFHFSIKETRPFLKIGGYTMGSSLLDFFSREVDIFIIGKLFGTESLGLYSLSKQLVLKLYSILNPIIINVLSPILSSLQNQKDELNYYFLKSINLLATFIFPIYLLFIILSKEILSILYGVNYINGYLVASFLAIFYCTFTIVKPTGSLQIATGRTDIGFIWTIIRFIITPLTIFITAKLCNSINTIAVAIASVGFLLIFLIWRIQIKQMTNISFVKYIKQFIKPYVIVLFISIIFIIFSQVYETSLNIISNMVIKSVIGILLFSGLIFLFDRKRFFEILNHRKTISSILSNK